MPVMTKMREKLHVVVYALVFFFLALIFFEWGMGTSGMTSSRNEAGSVNGMPITFETYEESLRQYRENYIKQTNLEELDNQTEARIEATVWDNLIFEKLFEEELENQNIMITQEEIVRAVHSDTPPAIIVQNFQDPKTRKIDKQKLLNALEAIGNKQAWVQVEEVIERELAYKKFQQLIEASIHVSNAEAERNYLLEKAKMGGDYVLFPLSKAKHDSTFTIPKFEIEKYYKDYREQYKRVPSRNAEFVFFTNSPTKEDTASIYAELEKIRSDFKTTSNDTDFVSIYSDSQTGFGKKLPETGVGLNSKDLKLLKISDVVGPYMDGEYIKLLKVKDKSNVVKASHILIKPKGSTKQDSIKALQKARRLLGQAKSGKNFAALAKKHSEEPGANTSGGDLGWFGKGKMVKEFEEVALKGKKGQILGPVKTMFGYHIIKIMRDDSLSLSGVEVAKKIVPSYKTSNKNRLLASEFQLDAERNGFDQAAKNINSQVRKTGDFQRNGFIPIIGYSREVSMFAFGAEEGTLSSVIQTADGFAVFKLVAVNDSKYKSFEEVESQIEKILIEERKKEELKTLAKKMLNKVGVFEKLKALDTLVQTGNISSATIKKPFLPKLGMSTDVVAAMIQTKKDDLTPPTNCSNGVAIVKVTTKEDKSKAEFEVNLKTDIEKRLREKTTQVKNVLTQSLKKTAEIVDQRASFFN